MLGTCSWKMFFLKVLLSFNGVFPLCSIPWQLCASLFTVIWCIQHSPLAWYMPWHCTITITIWMRYKSLTILLLCISIPTMIYWPFYRRLASPSQLAVSMLSQTVGMLQYWSFGLQPAKASGNKPLPGPMLTQIYVAIWHNLDTMS